MCVSPRHLIWLAFPCCDGPLLRLWLRAHLKQDGFREACPGWSLMRLHTNESLPHLALPATALTRGPVHP